MASLFLSHTNEDKAIASWLTRLQGAGFRALYLDFDPQVGTSAGRNSEPELYSQLRNADAIVFLASPASMAPRLCLAELALARSTGKPVFAVALDGTPELGLFEDVQWVDLGGGDEAVRRLLYGLHQAGLDPSDSLTCDPRRSPYPGLEPFAAEDASVLFGRDHGVERLLELPDPTLQRGRGRFLALVGPSGRGKSSLVRAGVLPHVDCLPHRWVLPPRLVPGQQPTRNPARSLAREVLDPERRSQRQLLGHFAQGSCAIPHTRGRNACITTHTGVAWHQSVTPRPRGGKANKESTAVSAEQQHEVWPASWKRHGGGERRDRLA